MGHSRGPGPVQLHTREASPTRSGLALATEKPVPWGRPGRPSCPAPLPASEGH